MTQDDKTTERRVDGFSAMHQRGAGDNLQDIFAGQAVAVQNMAAVLPAMELAVKEAAQRLRGTQGRLVYIGAGTSGRLGVQDGIELKPTYGWDRVAYALAGGDQALTRSIEGAEDDAEAGQARIAELNVGRDDVCIAVAASGSTPYTVAACEEAKERGALTIGIANNKNTLLLQTAAHKIALDSGAEIVAGSTRMNAGTVQKIALNALSTAMMIELGRVYNGYMVFVQPTCDKLVRRSQNIIQGITGCDAATASRFFNEAAQLNDPERRVPAAILAAAGGLDVGDAAALLRSHKDHFPAAFDSLNLSDQRP